MLDAIIGFCVTAFVSRPNLVLFMTIIKNIKKIIPRKKIAILIELIDKTSFMTKAPSSQSGDVSGLA